MYIIQIESNKIGSRPPLQEWYKSIAPDGYAICPDEFRDVFYSTNPSGFVNITLVNDDNGNAVVTEMTVNQEALDAYIASLPEPKPEPEPVEDVNYDDLAAAIIEGVNEI